MQQFKSLWLFVFGAPEKTSLSSQFCRENNYIHFKDPKIDDVLKNKQKHAIIQGSIELFKELQKKNPLLSVVLVGKANNKQEKTVCYEYETIGRLTKCPTYKYEDFRKQLYPNLIFIYGPVPSQNKSGALELAKNISYIYSQLANDPNDYINKIDKSNNYVINGLFQDNSKIKILSQYFEIRIIHLKYSRVDLPDKSQYFDKQYTVVNFLKDKSYYIPVDGKASGETILDEIGVKLCPKVFYIHYVRKDQGVYINKCIQETEGLLLEFEEIQAINKRKNIPLLASKEEKLTYLSSILYKDLNRKQVFLYYFPWALDEIIAFENMNRKISLFVELSDSQIYTYNSNFYTPTYFLENQKFFKPNKINKLQDELKEKVDYWIVSGAIGSGKTTISKFISSQFGFKHIEFDSYLANIKEKLLAPQDGEEVPVKKIIEHFRQLITNDKDSIYLIDGLPYQNKQLEEWVAAVGAPTVISLDVDLNQQIKRTRKKAQADLAAQVTQQENNKAKQSGEKSKNWIENLHKISASSKLYRINYNGPLIKVEDEIRKIIRPRIYLVQFNTTTAFQNIALKYNLGFVNLNKIRLRDSINEVKKCKRRDIILCNYGHEKKRLASQDLYWIEKYIGDIRYVGIWQNEDKNSNDEVMKIQRPPAPEKPKAAEGAEGQQKPPEDPPAEGDANKKKFDIYDYQWTKVGDNKNLSQWFFKCKKNITEYSNNPKDCYKNFENVLAKINQSSENNVYERIK